MAAPTIDLACLCAAWCRTCGDYRAVIDEVALEFASGGAALRWHWIDIEDEAELVGEFDVETLPTLVVADPEAVLFAGPLTPHAESLRRVVRAALDDRLSGSVAEPPPELQRLAARLRSRVPG